jgi:hypothetical protein
LKKYVKDEFVEDYHLTVGMEFESTRRNLDERMVQL